MPGSNQFGRYSSSPLSILIMAKITITELVLRDGHQSLLATRMRLKDMLPIAEKLDRVGYWSLESWGGATFDACIRFLGEDPWDRIRQLSQAMPNTPPADAVARSEYSWLSPLCQ